MAWSWYTKGRRIPTLIGKDVSGRRIPGGPYTGLQAVTAAGVPALLWWTRGLWAADMAGLAMIATIIGLTAAAVKLVGKIDFASRNPLLLLGGYLRQTGRPVGGTLAGRKLAEPKPHRITCTVEVTHTSLVDRPAADLSITDQAHSTQQEQTRTPTAVPARPAKSVDSALATPEAPKASIPAPQSTPLAPAAALRPAAPLAPDRRRTGLEAFLAGAAATRDATTEEDAA